jgi:hypothetical protein
MRLGSPASDEICESSMTFKIEAAVVKKGAFGFLKLRSIDAEIDQYSDICILCDGAHIGTLPLRVPGKTGISRHLCRSNLFGVIDRVITGDDSPSRQQWPRAVYQVGGLAWTCSGRIIGNWDIGRINPEKSASQL